MSSSSDPFSLNVRGVSDLVNNDTNKVGQGDSMVPAEGASAGTYGILNLEINDENLLRLRNEWEKAYAPYEAKIKSIVESNKESYIGKRKDGKYLDDKGEPVAANLQFSAEETFLAAALAKNPEPVVFSDNTPEGEALSKDVRTMLQFHADQLVLRRKLTFMARQWSINHLGVLKHGWDSRINDISTMNRKIQNFIFDPTGYVDAYGDFIGYLGERITCTADQLADIYPKHKLSIALSVENNMSASVTYTEWWSADDTYTFSTYKDIVLDKNKNHFFRYEEGERNHFAIPKKPYTFLSVFSLQEQPHDITGLIEQNRPNQNRISRRTDQIDFNVSAANNSFAFSQDNFTQETAKQAADARRMGNPILVPSGAPIDSAIKELPAQNMPASAFNDLTMAKEDLRESWGIQGITSQPNNEDLTARGQIINQQNDSTRIGGGIGAAIEQVADNVFNWWVQMYFVFYDEPHFASIMGSARAVEYVTISNQTLTTQLIVSVAPDSMRPRDEITEINLAQALFDKGAIGPKTLLKMLSFPNPDEAAADGVLYKIDPMAYLRLNFPDYFNQLQQASAPQPAPGGSMPPEAITEPAGDLSVPPADTSLNQVPLPTV